MMSPVFIIVMLVTLIVLGLVAYMIMAHQSARSQRAIQLVQGGVPTIKKKRDDQHLRRASIAGKLKEEQKNGNQGKKKNTVRQSLLQAGLQMSVTKYWTLSAIFAVVMTALLYLSGQSVFVVICGGLTALLGFPKLILKKMTKARQKKFLEDFPDALEAVVRLLKAGMPVSEAVAMSAKEFSGPVSEEMAHMYDRQKIGIPLHEAAYEACDRVALTEMNMFATSLAIQAQTGSSLSDVLINLSNMIRSRFRLKRKVKALSSEAIASAGIIAALPVLVAGGMYLTNKDYISILFTDPFGKVLLFGAIVWMGLGVVMMKVMINFKV